MSRKMKKITYILLAVLILTISFEPAKNIYHENKRIQNEQFINNYIEKNNHNYYEVKKLPKKARPDLKYYHDFIMTRDISLNEIPADRILDAIEEKNAKLNSFSFFDRQTEINWTERGPNEQGGRTRAIMLDANFANNGKVWAAGVSGGLWYNDNINSQTNPWIKISDFWDNLEISTVASDPNDENTIYVGSGEKVGSAGIGLGMWKTTDGGATWSQLSSTLGYRFMGDMVVRDESGTSAIYIGTGRAAHEGQFDGINGLWKSTDGGSTWTEMLGEISENSNHEVSDIELDADNRLWVGTRTNTFGDGGGQIFYSDDGSTFTLSDTSSEVLAQYDRVFIETYNGDANILYAMMENASTGYITAFIKSIDRGQTWTSVTIPTDDDGDPLGDYQGSMDYWGSLGIDPNNSDIIYAGAHTLFKSIDSGVTWTRISEWYQSQNLPYVHADQHNIIFIDSDKILFTNDGGVYFTNDGGNTFSHRNTGFNTTQFYSTAIHPTSEYILGGTQDNGTWQLTNPGIQVGTEVTGGDGGYVHIDQKDPSLQFTSYVYNRVYRSKNGGNSFQLWYDLDNNGANAGYFINPSVIDDTNKAFYATWSTTQILRQKNYTILTDHDFLDIPLGAGASAYKVSPYTSGVLFVGTAGGRIFKITDAHTDSYSYEDISPSDSNGYVSSIDIGKDDNQILFTQSNYGIESVYETVSGGGSNAWAKVEGDLPDMPVRWGLYNRNNFNQVALATEVGVWVSDDISEGEPVWYPSNDGLANVRVDMLSMNSNGYISAGTHGRGMFTSPGFTSTAPLNAAFSLDKTSGQFPIDVSFLDRSTGNPTSWEWNFGDGNSSNEQNPTHTYTSAGSYSVSLTVSDGSNSDSLTKSNSIFVTSVQDTLFTDGFESCFGDSYPLNGRNNYNWIWRDANGDDDGPGCYPESLNAGFDLSYDEDKGIGFGNAAADETSWDDWYISPYIWLRPNVDNLLKFYANGFNAEFPESFDIMLSPSGGSNISDFTETIASIVDQGAVWNEYSYDLTQWAGQKVRIAIHHKSQAQYYEFYDLFMITAGQLSEQGAPAAPSGITIEPAKIYEDTDEDGAVSEGDTWTDSDTSVAIYWNRNGEPDLASYNIYASQTDGFNADSNTLLGQGTLGTVDVNIPVYDANEGGGVLNANYFNVRSFGADSYIHENLSQGDTWYYKVGAVDNDGNETLSSQIKYIFDSTGPTTGTVTIDNIYNDYYIRSTTDISMTLDGWSDDVGIDYYLVGIGSTDTDTSTDVLAYQTVNPSDLSLSDLTLDDYTTYYLKVGAVDLSGNTSTAVITEFRTYASLLGDLDGDWDVDIEDLNAFVNAWPNSGVEPTVDIGPASGTSPYLSPSLDNTNDIKDLSVFSRNWLWTKAQGKVALENNEFIPLDFQAEIKGNQIIIELPDGITAGRFEIENKDNLFRFNADQKQGYIVLENSNDESEYYEFEFGKLSSNDNKLVINIDGAKVSNDMQLNYQLFSKDGLSGNGMMEINNLDEFKLYQNFPNPFNNQTTIKYDIPSLMVNMVDVKIYIYNTLGKLVRTIDEGDKSAGQFTTVWDSKNDDGEKVSSGVYFYQLRAKVDGQSDYNKTMKMVIVR